MARYRGHVHSSENGKFYVRTALSPDDRFLLSGSSDGHAYIWEVCVCVCACVCVCVLSERLSARLCMYTVRFVTSVSLQSAEFCRICCIITW